MKYLLPLILALFLTACSDSGKTVSEKQTTAPVEKPLSAVVPEKTEVKPVQEVAKVEPTPVQDVAKVELTGEAIFNKCKVCHGNNAEKQALATSQIIKGWEIAKIEQALHGYKDGTYGAKMKSTMMAQVKGLSDDDITKVATYIHSL